MMPPHPNGYRVRSEDTEAWCGLAEVLAMQGKFAEAIRCDRMALQLNPEDACAHFNLGKLLEAQGKKEEAGEQYRRAARLNARPAK